MESKKAKIDRLFKTMDKLANLGGEPMSMEEINTEIAAARKERRE